jgi:hypothetical protein
MALQRWHCNDGIKKVALQKVTPPLHGRVWTRGQGFIARARTCQGSRAFSLRGRRY